MSAPLAGQIAFNYSKHTIMKVYHKFASVLFGGRTGN